MKITIIRFIEFILSSFLLSALMLCIYYVNILPKNSATYGIMFTVAAIAFVAIQLKLLRITFTLIAKKKRYYVVNFIAYFLFMLLTVVVYKFIDGKYIYTWIFGTTKFLSYFSEKINTVRSATIFHAIMLAVIYFAPVGLEKKVKPRSELPEEYFVKSVEELSSAAKETEWDGTEDYTNNPEKNWYKPDEINFGEEAPEWDGTEDYTNNPEKNWYKPDEINFEEEAPEWDGTEDYTNNPEKNWYKPEEINFREEAEEWDGTSDYRPYIPEKRRKRKRRW